MDENQHTSQWPPPPKYSSNEGKQENQAKASAKLLTGEKWSDAMLGFFLSIVSSTLLTFVLANPIAASAILHLPIFDRLFSSEARLLTGWSLALGFQFAIRHFAIKRNFRVLGFSILWTALSVAFSWLFIILVACWLFG